MAQNRAIVLMNSRSLSASDTQEQGTIPDLAGFGFLAAQLRVFSTATGTLLVQHSASLSQDDSDWSDLFSLTLGTAATDVQTTINSGFLRYVRWKVDISSGGPAIASIYLVAKEST